MRKMRGQYFNNAAIEKKNAVTKNESKSRLEILVEDTEMSVNIF